ncbi:MAG TPA: diguanylate cyclase [Tepidisphaeraceae bacterium]|jgi:diguanylate cyclase (GGDEF)-like protein|nr:diguanylate cyclase [Tepidisphaeraceae bacterium]
MIQRILIIDDSLPLHQLIRSQVEHEGWQFHCAYDGQAGIEMALELRPSVILLDVDIPDISGFEVCRRLKANVETSSIPVVFLSADLSTGDKVRGLDLGAVDYITKPFKAAELSARLRASIRVKQLLDQKAMIDGLTGLWNRKYLEDHLAAQTSLAVRSGRPTSYIVADVDRMRQINKKHGIPFGDEILRSLSNILLSQCRAEDAVCRLDGARFAIVLSAMNRTGAGRLAERLSSTIQTRLLSRAGKDVGVTCSFGVADSLVTGDVTLLERAELAMIRAKQNGGACVVIARPPRKEKSAA